MPNDLAIVKKPKEAPFAVLAEIAKAKEVYLFVHGDYSDSYVPEQVKVSKAEARRIVSKAYKNHPPRWKWQGDKLLVFPRYMEV